MGLRSWVWTHETAYCAVGYEGSDEIGLENRKSRQLGPLAEEQNDPPCR